MRKGFALIELMIVAGIIAVVAAMAIPSLAKKAREQDAFDVGQVVILSETGREVTVLENNTKMRRVKVEINGKNVWLQYWKIMNESKMVSLLIQLKGYRDKKEMW